MKALVKYITILLILLTTACSRPDNDKLVIATAANMQFAMKELVQKFTSTSGIECEAIFSSSGKLASQIMEGAPFDVFVSADTVYPTTLFNNGFTVEKPEIYAQGKLVLWSMEENITPSIDLLTSDKIKHIAIANPDLAPYGSASIEVLRHFGLYEKIREKLVIGESISQTNQFIISGASEIGFTAKSVVLSTQMSGKGKWIDIDPGLYSPISQGAVIIRDHEKNLDKSRKFIDFLISDEAKDILNNFGYIVDLE